MDDLLTRVRQNAQRYRLFTPGETVVVGVSAGRTRCACSTCSAGWRLSCGCGSMSRTCTTACAALRPMPMPVFVVELADCGACPAPSAADVAALACEAGLSLEEAARQARYRFLAEVAEAGGVATLAVGHNADDQAETVLMHFLRGSGVAGLRGMLPNSPLDDYRLFQAVFHAGIGATAGGDVGQVANLSYEPISRTDDHAGRGATADENVAQAAGLSSRAFKAGNPADCGTGPFSEQISTCGWSTSLVRSPSGPRVSAFHLVRPLLAIPRAVEIEAYCADYRLVLADRSAAMRTRPSSATGCDTKLLPILETYNPGIL